MTQGKANHADAAMQLIINGGNAKSAAMAAIKAAKIGDFKTATTQLQAADDALKIAHDTQTSLLTKDAEVGYEDNMNILLAHGLDYVMNAMTYRDMAGEIVDLYQQLVKK